MSSSRQAGSAPVHEEGLGGSAGEGEGGEGGSVRVVVEVVEVARVREAGRTVRDVRRDIFFGWMMVCLLACLFEENRSNQGFGKE